MSTSDPKSARSTHSSQPLTGDRNQQDETFATDVIHAVSSPRRESKQLLITQEAPSTKEYKENVVHKSKFPTNMWTTNDELLRLHYINKLEKSQQTDWPYKWGFLIDEYKTLSDDMAAGTKSKNEIQKQIDILRKVSPSEISAMTQDVQPGPVPETSSGMIGWKASKKDYIQSKYPEYLREKYCTDSFEKQMKWPFDSQP